ncbi:MAG: gliding motility-associated C-terminal domain-containing protein [Fulvivirga sp.]|uniref:T9SS type B sorting domain-containing protein n=1 Tax=Fulvivirga sp. TaxID=1931237 RepID=UPI0032EEA326
MLNQKLRRGILLLVFVVGSLGQVLAQGYSGLNWFFGSNNRNFRFVRPNLTTENVNLPNPLGTGGSAVATDPVSGALLFYTDGITVFDPFDNALSPNLIGNNTFNQGVVICANPADSLQYYIFTNDGSQIRRSVFDRSQNSGLTPGFPAPGQGNLVTPINDIANLPSGSLSEGMIVIPNDVLDGFWLLTYDETADTYNVTGIDNTGAISTNTQAVVGAPTSVANFSFNSATNQIAVAPANPAEEVAILTIDRTNGNLALTSTIANTNVSGELYNIYDTEWNNNGDILYLSGNFGDPTDSLMQINFTDTPPRLRPVSGQNLSRSFGLQMGPDSTIYHLYQAASGQFRVGRINDPDTTVAQTFYDPTPIGNANYAAQQFPAFLPQYDPMTILDFDFAGICANVPTLFFPLIDPPADSVAWDFGDGNFSRLLTPVNTYAAGGPFDVTLVAFSNGVASNVTKTINMTDFDIQIAGFPQIDTLCAEDFPATYTAQASGSNANSVTFRWSNQDTDGPTTTISEPGNYYVIGTDPNGCEAYAPLQVVEYRAIEQRAFIWYFGNNAGIDFNPISENPPGPIAPIPFGDPNIFNGGNQMQTPEGCAIYCDDNGNPIFYTDGEAMYDREGNEFATDIGGSEGSTQSSLIVPAPGDATLYYVFLTRQIYSESGEFEYELVYTVFDLKERSGLGDLVRNTNGDIAMTKLYNGNTERITGNQNWVIVHEFGNNNFRAYPITGVGIGNAVVSNVGSVHPSTSATAGQGYMKLSTSSRLAVALSISNNENYVELFQFVDSTGAVTRPVTLDLAPETGQLYGIEFSPDENKLFATLRNAGGTGTKIFRWEIDTTTVVNEVTDPSHIINSREELVDETGVDLGAMQQGPDGLIYIANDGAGSLATLTTPDEAVNQDPPQNAGYNLSGFTLAGGTTSTLGLPNFLNQFNTSPGNLLLSVFNGCSGEPLDFAVANPSSLEQYRWRINDSNGNEVLRSSVTDQGQFSFSITTPGTYTAIVDVIPECSTFDVPVNSVQLNFVINPLPNFSITNVVDPTSCGGNDGRFDLDLTDAGTFVYAVNGPVGVSPDTVTAPIVVPITGLSAGGYTVTITNALTGCIETAVTTLNDPAPYTLTASAIGADCAGLGGGINVSVTNPAVLDIRYLVRDQNTSSIVLSGSEPTRSFIIADVPVGTYLLEVTDGDNCTLTRSDLVIATPPLANLVIPEEVIVCDDQPADIVFSSTNAISIQVSGPGAPTFIGDDPTDPDTIRVNSAGAYTITAQGDNATICDNIALVQVIFNSPSPNPFDSRYVICPDDPVVENQTVAFPNPPSGFESVRWFEPDGDEITANTTDYQFNTAGDSLIVLGTGVLTAELTNFFGCVTVAEIGVIEDCKARINAPNAFSPNGDGINDNFLVFPVLVSEEDFEIFIFNRWGEMVFQSDQLDFEWNGGYNNDESRPLTGGTYAYRVNFKSAAKPEEGIKEQRGGVTLIR